MCISHGPDARLEIRVVGDPEEKLTSAIVLPVLVARTSLLRDHLRPRQSLNYHHSVAHYCRSPTRLDSIRRHLSSNRGRGGFFPVHHLPVQSSLILLAPRLTHQPWDLHQQGHAHCDRIPLQCRCGPYRFDHWSSPSGVDLELAHEPKDQIRHYWHSRHRLHVSKAFILACFPTPTCV